MQLCIVKHHYLLYANCKSCIKEAPLLLLLLLLLLVVLFLIYCCNLQECMTVYIPKEKIDFIIVPTLSFKFKVQACDFFVDFWISGFSCRILCVFLIQVELPGCKGIWAVYHKSSRGHTTDPSKTTTEEDEYHSYLIISMESRTMVRCLPPLNCMEPRLISIVLLLLVLVIF